LRRLELAFVQQRIFVSDSAHELNSAVALINSSLQLLSLRPRTTVEYAAGLDRALSDTERLEDLVSRMLMLARLEGGASAAGPLPCCDIVACLRQAVAQLETFAALHRVRIGVTSPTGDGPSVPIEGGDCILLISNLLLNALQHSPPESSVQLRLTAGSAADPAVVELAVEDHGEGIAAGVLPRVFDRFYRGDPSRARSTGGAGLGLAIAKAIVERAGGSIRLESKPGQGTTVTVSLPCIATGPSLAATCAM